ncbi:hypothetical protein [Leifsonia sp. LS-T14]|uniref:hypothetical protein n=1 Tax=unclassified Leifsonia TaxID=2663824 RepID=UPI0035A6D538
MFRAPFATAESVESAALVVGSGVFVVGAVIAAAVFWGRELPISGTASLGQFIAVAGAISAAVVFAGARILLRTQSADGVDSTGGTALPLNALDIAALALAHGLIALLGWTAVGDVIERCFSGAVVFTFPSVILAGVALAITAYVTFLSAVKMTAVLLSLVLAVFLVVGVFTSMLSASDPHWWKENLSALGMTDDLSALAFNLTLIVAGVIVTTVAHAATAGMAAGEPAAARGRRLVRIGLSLIGVFLACVGVFPVDRFLVIHNTVAMGMVGLFAALAIGLRWLIPQTPHVFVWLGYVFVAVIVVVGVFFATGYYNLTAVELVAAIVIFGWIILFLRTVGTSGASHVVAQPGPRQTAGLAKNH